MKYCNCQDFKDNINKINKALMHIHTQKQFKYCPWCGKKLNQITIDKID